MHHEPATIMQALLDGASPNGTAPEQCGPWAETVQALYTAHQEGGTAQVRRTFDVLARANAGLAALLASEQPVRERAERSEAAMPALPASVLVTDTGRHAWLDAYVAHSRYWSPRSYEDYHEAIGIWLLSAVAARRVVAHLGKPRFTPLCLALAGRSSLYAKTTAAEVGMEVLRAAGLDWLLATDSATPQKFVYDRVRRVPPGYLGMEHSAQQLAQQRLAFAGQCGWWYDEFGMLLSSMARSGSVMADFSGLLRRFDDCAPAYRSGTISRGDDEIINPYVALLAALTPADLRPLMRRGSVGWTNGLWPRWAFICPPDDGSYRTDRFPAGVREPPRNVVQHLREWHAALGTPTVHIDLSGDDARVDVGPLPQTTLTVLPAVRDAYYAYSDALIGLVAAQEIQELDSWYARLHDRVLRVALLLASVDGSDVVDVPHWGRALAMGERWRASLHRLYQQTNSQQEATNQATAEEAVLEVVQRLGNPSVRDIKTRITWLSRAEIQTHVDQLAQAGVLTAVASRNSVRYIIPTLVQPFNSEDEEVKK